ncbi:hypothetical protein GH714_024867 [Hevea brasiliensis]|uniref:Uncharacterized protein n=1 Tax=Hevea brasiliensis TaxID=3981 RepID=A0A6A6NJ74_HEVBR|nr:hypothetical protein GH714_024867 [Hevea brasiliensis]
MPHGARTPDNVVSKQAPDDPNHAKCSNGTGVGRVPMVTRVLLESVGENVRPQWDRGRHGFLNFTLDKKGVDLRTSVVCHAAGMPLASNMMNLGKGILGDVCVRKWVSVLANWWPTWCSSVCVGRVQKMVCGLLCARECDQVAQGSDANALKRGRLRDWVGENVMVPKFPTPILGSWQGRHKLSLALLVSWSYCQNRKGTKEQLKLIDVVIEVRDARIPLSTTHPQIYSEVYNPLVQWGHPSSSFSYLMIFEKGSLVGWHWRPERPPGNAVGSFEWIDYISKASIRDYDA